MNFVSAFMCVFSMLGALDRIFGNRFGLGKQFERGFMLLGNMALSMIGMICISPLIADLAEPLFDAVHSIFGLDPSIIPSSLFANDMGGYPLSLEIAKDPSLGSFNGLVVSSMLGCTVSFTIPYMLGVVDKPYHRKVFLGYLCGIATIPLGCFAAGLVLRLPIGVLLFDLLPIIIFSALVALGLALIPNVLIKLFTILGKAVSVTITVGLALAILKALTGLEPIPGLDEIKVGADVCFNAAVVMSGSFPFVYVVSKLIEKPMKLLGGKLGINSTSAMGLVSSLATCATTYEMIPDMDDKGIVMNAAFTVSGAFVFASHLAFTLAFDKSHVIPVIIAKLISGISSVVLAAIICKKMKVGGKEQMI